MEPPTSEVTSPQLLADEDVGQTSINQLGTQSQWSASQDQRQPRLETDGWERQPLGVHGLQLQFQDSNLSPALSLLPANSRGEHNFTEYSLFQQSDTEFAPLRAYPDDSMASERFHFPPHDHTTQVSECDSLSQHPLAQATILSEEGGSSCHSPSQHSLSPVDKQEKIVHLEVIATADDRQRMLLGEDTVIRDKDPKMNPPDKPAGQAAEDETFFLNKDVPAQRLLELLQKDVGVPSSSSSAFSSVSETAVKSTLSFTEESKSTKVCKVVTDQSLVKREGPPGEASFPQQQTQRPDSVSNTDQPRAPSSQVCNITMGSRSTQPDDSSEVLHRELLSEVERRSNPEAEPQNKEPKSPAPPVQSLTPSFREVSEGKPGVIRTYQGGVAWTGPFSAGVERNHREHDLWSSGNQTGIDGSYLGFLPQSQSTPGIFLAPRKSSAKAKLGQLSAIESNKGNSYQSSTGISLQPAEPGDEVYRPGTATKHQHDAASAKVQSLPSLNYMQKVDAWRANQSSGKTSLFDSLALQGFSGISPKKKAYDAVSESLNRILSQHVRTAQQPLVSDAANHDVTQSSSTAPSASFSPRRGEAVGSAPSDKDNTVSAAAPSASPVGRSQSHSSLSTVVMSVHKDQQTEMAPEKEKRQGPDDAPLHPSAAVQPLPFISLSQFSDVSLDRDLTFSSSQDSYSGIQVGASVGASSIVSLELDNYAPYWASRLSTPPPPRPRPRELNIDERIPLYLHNLGIDQSPSTILTPFVPRGPIREPEFSPTDLCTLKGSTGTPTKSAQPSEGGSPHKGDVSRSSILSVDSSMSIPFSLDSLGPAVSLPERVRRPSPPSDTEALQTEHSMAPSSPSPDEDSHSSVLQPSQQLDNSLTSSQNFNQQRDKCDPDVSLEGIARQGQRSLESPLQTSVDQTAEDSFVSSKALLEIRRLLSHAETVISTGSSAGSSTSPSLRKKTNGLQDSLFSSSSTAGDPGTHSSMLWTRSSSDSMLTSDKLRQSSVGRENMASSWQPDYPSTPALITAPATVTHTPPPHSTLSSGAGTSPVISKSARRTEPEGCSAAPPDTQPPVTKPQPAVSTQQPSSAPADAEEVQEEEEKAAPEGPVPSSSPSPVPEDTDQGATSDGSSESSLAIRVAKLLQTESPATMVSSPPSTMDHEESKAREWIKSKISGQQCEPLELDKEDRKRIEEIKRDLLLQNPMKSQWSTDTESSASSSVRVQRELDPPQSAEALAALRNVNNKPSQTLRGLGTNPPDSNKQLQNAPHGDLEARVCEIAAREGVILPRKNHQALTSITIATRRTSTSPSPSSSPAPPLSPAPEPLHLAELSTETVIPPTTSRQLHPSLDEEDPVVLAQITTREPPTVYELSSSQHIQSAVGNQERQGAVGGQSEEHVPGSQGLDREDRQSFRRGDELSVQNSSVTSDGLAANQATGSSTVQSPTTTDHISHVHLTLSPKTINRTITTTVPSGPLKDVSPRPPRKEFVPLRHSPSAASSPDEGVGLASPPEWCDTREPVRQRAPERSDTSTLFKTAVPQRRTTSLATQFFTPRHRSEISPRAFTAETPVPVLLPYKPHGSEEFFYVPQTEAEVSSTERSDTTMESSHTGSDDAVPPRFSSEVLGHQDPGLDRGVTIRHTEGIYNKRLKTATFKMQGPEHTDASEAASKMCQTPEQSPQVSAAFSRVLLSNHQDVLTRDQGTSPVQFLRDDEPEPSRAATTFYHGGGSHLVQTSIPRTGGEQDQQGSITLDQLWQKFCDRWDIEKSRPTSDKETSLLERLERLSRLIHGTRAPNVSAQEEEHYPEQKLGRRREDVTLGRTEREAKRSVCGEVVRGGGGGNAKPSIQLRLQESSQPAEDDSHASSSSSFSLSSSHSQHLSPGHRDEAETLSTTSGSMSTVDTARLIRAFGAHRVQHLKSNSSLSKLYSTINRQKEGREQRRGRHRDPPHTITPSETEGSVVDDSASSPSKYTVPSHHGPSRSLAAKKVVKLVNKSVQAGDLEIVSNSTRQHTRDVGTTFPSPREAGAFRQSSSSSSSSSLRGRGGQRSPSKAQSVQKQRKNKKSSTKLYPECVSWFIPADDLRSESRKENRPEEELSSPWKPSTAWFEPYSRIPPWREPLRQRQVHEDRNRQPSVGCLSQPDQDPAGKTGSSGLARVSLQEALELRRPEFISRSRQRLKCLSLQVEERKLQEELSRERGELLFSRPGGAARLQRPAGTALLRRAVPRKEMIQRSKQIYENLPEVQRRREEERRKAEYRSYRLNAQLYNKRITNRVLGKRSAWQ